MSSSSEGFGSRWSGRTEVPFASSRWARLGHDFRVPPDETGVVNRSAREMLFERSSRTLRCLGEVEQLVFSVAVLAFVIATFPLVASRYRRRIRELARRYRDRED